MGSGSLNAMAVFEDGFKEDMGVEDAKKLVARAIRSGIYNDLGSGSNVDLCIIYKDKVSSSHQISHVTGVLCKFQRVYHATQNALGSKLSSPDLLYPRCHTLSV